MTAGDKYGPCRGLRRGCAQSLDGKIDQNSIKKDAQSEACCIAILGENERSSDNNAAAAAVQMPKQAVRFGSYGKSHPTYQSDVARHRRP